MSALRLALALLIASVVWQIPAAAQGSNNDRSQLNQNDMQRITRDVHHQLVMLPYYGLFDNLAYKVSTDGTVTLVGQVTRPTLKSDAENVVKKIEGVEHVDNQIQGASLCLLTMTKYGWLSIVRSIATQP